jgi:dTDP-4-dehydrorhamnose reductase
VKIALTGISGLLGLNAAVALRQRHSIAGAFFDHAVDVEGVACERLDVGDRDAVASWLDRVRPDLVLHTAGLTDVEGCEANPQLAARLNTAAAAHVAAAAREAGAQLLHMSTDHLFDGHAAAYREDQTPSPINVYAATKLDAEGAVLDAHPEALLIRTNFYGWGHPRRRSFSDWIVGSLRSRTPLRMFHDVYFTPILVNDLIDVMLDLARTAPPGIYNVAGGERLSKYDFAMKLAERFDLDTSLITSASVDTFAFRARRPRDMSLDTTKAAAIVGRPMPGVTEGLQRLRQLEGDGLPAALAAAFGQPAAPRRDDH